MFEYWRPDGHFADFNDEGKMVQAIAKGYDLPTVRSGNRSIRIFGEIRLYLQRSLNEGLGYYSYHTAQLYMYSYDDICSLGSKFSLLNPCEYHALIEFHRFTTS